jgi:hypothetical protein
MVSIRNCCASTAAQIRAMMSEARNVGVEEVM